MKVILEYFVGAVIVIADIVKHLYRYLRDSLLIIFSSNRKNNIIYYRLKHTNYFIDIAISMCVFFAVAQFSTILACLFTFGFMLWFFSTKDDKNDKDSLQFGIFVSVIIICVAVMVYSNVKTPYTYTPVGEITLTDKDIKEEYSDRDGNMKTIEYRDIEVTIDGQLEDVEIYGCKAGKYTVFKETLEPKLISIVKTDFMLECDSSYEAYKRLEE